MARPKTMTRLARPRYQSPGEHEVEIEIQLRLIRWRERERAARRARAQRIRAGVPLTDVEMAGIAGRAGSSRFPSKL